MPDTDASNSSLTISIPLLPPPPSAFVELHDEVVLYYCACMVSYTAGDVVGSPGFLYLSPHYIGLACRAGIGVGARRRELMRLQDLYDVEVCGGDKGDHHASTTSFSTPSNKKSTAVGGGPGGGKAAGTPGGGAASSGWSLASLQQSLRISNVTSGCRLRFRLPVVTADAVDTTHLAASEHASGHRTPNSSRNCSNSDCLNPGDKGDEVTYEVTVFPALVESVKVQAVLIEARDMLLNSPPGA